MGDTYTQTQLRSGAVPLDETKPTNMRIPCSYRFRPTNQEAIELFLMRRARNQPLLDGHEIVERTVYGDKSPWDVFTADDPWEICNDSNQKIIYCFSKVVSRSAQSKNRVVRTAGCGTWDGKAVSTKVKDSDGKVIGHKRAFTFKPKKGVNSDGRKGKWIMHEFSLAQPEKFVDPDCVFCRITAHYSLAGNVAGNNEAAGDAEAGDEEVEEVDEDEDNDSGETNELLGKRNSKKRKQDEISRKGSLDKGKNQNQESNVVAAEGRVNAEALKHPAEGVPAMCELRLGPTFPFPPGLQIRPPQQQQASSEYELAMSRARAALSRVVLPYSSLVNKPVIPCSEAQVSSSPGTDDRQDAITTGVQVKAPPGEADKDLPEAGKNP